MAEGAKAPVVDEASKASGGSGGSGGTVEGGETEPGWKKVLLHDGVHVGPVFLPTLVPLLALVASVLFFFGLWPGVAVGAGAGLYVTAKAANDAAKVSGAGKGNRRRRTGAAAPKQRFRTLKDLPPTFRASS